MSWQNISQIEERLNDSPLKNDLNRLYNLHALMTNAVFPEGYKAKDMYAQYLVPSEHAYSILKDNPLIQENYADADISLALLDIFYYHEALIDVSKSNIDEAIKLFSSEIKSNEVKLTYRYGRVLYDRFNDYFNDNKTDHLEPQEVHKLLDTTEQGVYQVGNLVAGPLGILESKEVRYMPARLNLPLWHCSDTGCNHLHKVNLLQTHCDIYNIYQNLSALLEKKGPPSEWKAVFSYIHREGIWPKGRPFINLCSLIGDSVVGKERVALVKQILVDDSGKFVREELNRIKKKEGDGSAEQVAERLSDATRLQVIFLLKDSDIVRCLDKAVIDLSIRIPANEVRKSYSGYTTLSSYDTTCELSLYGVRSAGKEPLVSLTAAIWSAYEKENYLNELVWRCTKSQVKPNRGIVIEYIRKNTPQEVIKSLVIPSRAILDSVTSRF